MKFAGGIIILHVYQKSQSYDLRYLRYGVRQTKTFVILSHFLPFYHSLMIPKIKILKKKKKKLPGDIVLL